MTYANTFAALSDPTRLQIFEALRAEEQTVGELAKQQPVSRPAVSQHLKILETAGLVAVRAEGTRRYYSVKREGLAELRQYLDSFWSDALSAYAAEIDRRMKTN